MQDRSHARHTRISSLMELEEQIVIELRVRVRLSGGDILEVMRRCLGSAFSRSALYRALNRSGISRLPSVDGDGSYQAFDVESKPGFLHVDVKYLTRLNGRRNYVYVGIDRATRYVYVKIHDNLRPATAAGFVDELWEHLDRLEIVVRTILSDNGMEWTDRYAGGHYSRPTGRHAVDRVCSSRGIEHRLTRVRRPQTNGMAERFNRRISEALAGKEKIKDNSGRNCFSSH